MRVQPCCQAARYCIAVCLLFFFLFAQPHLAAQGPASDTAGFQELSEKANRARDEGNSEQAIADYSRALKIRPDWPDGWWYLGTLHADRGNYSEAIASFTNLVKLKPNFGPGWASLGLCEFETKDYQQSRLSLQKARDLGFADVPALEKAATYHLALLLIQDGDFENAWELLASRLGKGPLAAQTKTALGLALLRVALLPDQVDPSKDALLDAAGGTAALLVNGNFERAIESFQRMEKKYSNIPFLHYAYGSALMFQSRYGEAETQLREETRITPNSALPYVRLAIIALKTKQAAKGIPDATRATQLAPSSAIAHEVLGRVLSEIGKPQEGAKEAEVAAQLKPERPQVNEDVARLYALKTSPGEIHAASTQASGSASENFDVVAHEAELAKNSGNRDEARADYERALQLRPDWAKGWSDLGNVYFSSGNCGRAVTSVKNAIGIDRKLPEPWVFLALCEFEGKDYQNSYLHLERAREQGYHGNAREMTVAVTRLAQLRNLNGDFYGAAELLIPEARRGRLTDEMKGVLGLALLRLPVLQIDVLPANQPLIRDAGEAAALLHASKYDEAMRALDEMSKRYPKTPFLHLAYAEALETLSRYDDAETQLNLELSITPDNPLVHMRRAAIAVKLHRFEQALDAARKAVEADAGSAGGHELMGRALLELGRVDEATKELEIASKLAPDYPEVHYHLARAYTRAKLNSKAQQERAIFAELNDAIDRQKSSQAQAYGVPQVAAEPTALSPR
jgi:tetratricopeptide (TPR) repeat protein